MEVYGGPGECVWWGYRGVWWDTPPGECVHVSCDDFLLTQEVTTPASTGKVSFMRLVGVACIQGVWSC